MARPAYSHYTDMMLRFYFRAVQDGKLDSSKLSPVSRLNFDACTMVLSTVSRPVRDAAQAIYTDRRYETSGQAFRAYLDEHPDERETLPYELRAIAKRLARARWLAD